MIEYLGECHHDCHNVMDAVGHTKMLAAQYYTSILTQLTNHKNDKHVHITTEDREKWDSKADKSSIRDLEMSLINKANKNEIPRNVSELKNDVPYLTAATLESQLEALGYVTLHDIKCKLCNNFNLDDYATIDWVNSILSRYALKTDLDNYYTKAEANAKFALKGDYLTKAVADGYYQPKGDYALRSEIPTIPEIPSLAGYLKNTDFNYISSVPASGSGIYTLGRIVVGNTEYPIYGRDMDTTTSGNNGSTVSYTPNGLIAQSADSYVIGTLTIDGTAYVLYGKDTAGSGGSGSGSGSSSDGGSGYDDTYLRGLIDGLRADLEAFRTQKSEEISEDVEDLIEQFNTLKNLFETGEIFHDSGWQEKLDAYLQIVGKGFYDEDGNLIGTWSLLLQTYNQIKDYIAQVKEIVDPETGVTVNYEAIYSKIDQKIAENTAINALTTNYTFTDGQKSLIEYLSSGFDSYANSHSAYSDLYSTLSASGGSGMSAADITALLQSYVDKNTYEAQLSAQANTTTYLIKRDANGIPVLDNNGRYIYVDQNGNTVSAANKVIDTNNTSGLVLSTSLDAAVAALLANDATSDTKAAITAIATADGSSITLSADQINAIAAQVDVSGSLNTTDLTINGGKSRFNQDGSGYVANQNISWNTSGDITLKGNTIRTSNTSGYVVAMKEDSNAGYLTIAPYQDVESGNYGTNGGYLVTVGSQNSPGIRMVGGGGYNGMYYDVTLDSHGLTVAQKTSATSTSMTNILTVYATGSQIYITVRDPQNPTNVYTEITPGRIYLNDTNGSKTITTTSN